MSYTEMEEDLHLMGSFEDETALGEQCATQQQHKNAAKLQAVHQAYRKMEKIKRYYHIDTEGLMRRQQALLDNLKSDNDALQEMVDTYVIKDYRQQMAHLLEEANKYTGLVEAETKRLHDLEATICSLGIQELDSKKIMGGYKAGWTKHRTTQIHIQQDENRLQKEMDGLDMVKQDHIFGKPAPENGDSKSSVAARKYETDQTVDYLLDSLRHLEIDDEAFVPVVIDMKKQILLVFKEAGCYIKDEALGIGSDPGHEKCYKKSPDNQPLELTVGKFFSKLEDFVDRISGTFS